MSRSFSRVAVPASLGGGTPAELPPLPALTVQAAVEMALREDLGVAGDRTTDVIVPAAAMACAAIVARSAGRIAGTDLLPASFRSLDPRVQVDVRVADGYDVDPGTVIAIIEGPARAILTGERTALNFLGHLSGIATVTRDIVRAVTGSTARICCTRKTTPGLRAVEKHAVRAGGGVNHRFGLGDGVLIKDNHLAVAGSIRTAVERALAGAGHMVMVEVEVDTLAQLAEALETGVHAVLLDNMTPDQLRQAVALAAGRVILEASGGITPETAPAVAATGVDLISVGWITHSAPSLDVALDFHVDTAV